MTNKQIYLIDTVLIEIKIYKSLKITEKSIGILYKF